MKQFIILFINAGNGSDLSHFYRNVCSFFILHFLALFSKQKQKIPVLQSFISENGILISSLVQRLLE